MARLATALLCAAATILPQASAQWTSLGANSYRNSRAAATGPGTPKIAWSYAGSASSQLDLAPLVSESAGLAITVDSLDTFSDDDGSYFFRHLLAIELASGR